MDEVIRIKNDGPGIARQSGVDEHGAAWIEFEVDAFADQTACECSICGAEIESGWLCLDGGDEVCDEHVEMIEEATRCYRAGQGGDGLMRTCALCLDPQSNHSTEQHEQALADATLCTSCGKVKDHDDDERTLCSVCHNEYWEWRMEVYYDNLAKASDHA